MELQFRDIGGGSQIIGIEGNGGIRQGLRSHEPGRHIIVVSRHRDIAGRGSVRADDMRAVLELNERIIALQIDIALDLDIVESGVQPANVRPDGEIGGIREVQRAAGDGSAVHRQRPEGIEVEYVARIVE